MVTNEESQEINELIKISKLPSSKVFKGSPKKNGVIKLLKKLKLDYIFGIHFPYIISEELIKIPSSQFLNLHPSYLPYNKGWHTPSWAILKNTPAGASLHYMSKELDMGNIILRKEVKIDLSDTAASLYKKIKLL
ncbi:MAG: formyltransferase family protein [Eudoraea sp.]|uniref:formyltransferase family protein n=1 Tax=Eudoraea sp. TaxID=1979955 RepID=UPI003266D7CA